MDRWGTVAIIGGVLVWSWAIIAITSRRASAAARQSANAQSVALEAAVRIAAQSAERIAGAVGSAVAASVDRIINPQGDVEVEPNPTTARPQPPLQGDGETDIAYHLRLAALGFPTSRPPWAEPDTFSEVYEDPIDLDKPLDAFDPDAAPDHAPGPFTHAEDDPSVDVDGAVGAVIERERAVVVPPGYDPIAEMGHPNG